MWNGGSTELQVTKGYWTAVGAKLLPIVDETFCSISYKQRKLLSLRFSKSMDRRGMNLTTRTYKTNKGLAVVCRPTPMLKLVKEIGSVLTVNSAGVYFHIIFS